MDDLLEELSTSTRKQSKKQVSHMFFHHSSFICLQQFGKLNQHLFTTYGTSYTQNTQLQKAQFKVFKVLRKTIIHTGHTLFFLGTTKSLNTKFQLACFVVLVTLGSGSVGSLYSPVRCTFCLFEIVNFFFLVIIFRELATT